MSAAVCGKRSSSIFEEQQLPLPIYKRSRCGPLSPSRDNNPVLAHLRSLFPQMNHELLERALEASGNDIDSAIKSLTSLCLEPENIISTNNNPHTQTEDINNNNDNNTGSNSENTNNNYPSGGSEWVELFVREMMNASDMDDARTRATRALEVLEKSIVSRTSVGTVQNLQNENSILKGQMEPLLRENSILKRAVAIQHERQKEQEEKTQELHHLKQLVSQYQEQVRNLEVTNYALTMHLQQAQQGNSMPGRFHPDVF